MSSRVLKKLHGEPDLEIKEQEEQQSDIENEINNGAKKKQFNINRYDLVNYIIFVFVFMCMTAFVCTKFTLCVMGSVLLVQSPNNINFYNDVRDHLQ